MGNEYRMLTKKIKLLRGFLNWRKTRSKCLEEYLSKEINEGKTEFRLVARKEGQRIIFYMHPDGKNGETFDHQFDSRT